MSDAQDEFDDDEQFVDPAVYLWHISDALCLALRQCTQEERRDWMAQFRGSADEIGIDWIKRGGLSDEDEVRAILSPGNMDAMRWATAHIEHGLACTAEPDDPDTVIGRLYWPTLPGCRARDD